MSKLTLIRGETLLIFTTHGEWMLAKKSSFFNKIQFHLTLILCLFLTNSFFISEVNADVLILKNGQTIRADKVKMKNGNLVEYKVGNETKVIEFSKVDSILPENPVSKKPKVKPGPALVLEESPKVVAKPQIEEGKVEKAVKEDIPFSKSRTSRTLQALVPGWSPLLLADDRRTQLSGGLIALSELIVLYRGYEFFHSSKPYFRSPLNPSPESVIPLLASSLNTGATLYFQIEARGKVITTEGHIMEKSEYQSQQKFYGIALFALISLDIYLSNTILYRGNLKSVSLSPLDGGHGSSISITWVF
ncbi:hypothetical protein [Leptospira stimsonii]|nr:hypothetical protein [Leptospira stimsonii]